MSIKKLGKRAENIWNDLRPVTKALLEKALKTKQKKNIAFDAHSDWELSKLLKVLDEEMGAKIASSDVKTEMRDLAEVCANLLESQTESAEVFIQLASRAVARNDFARLDRLADILLDRFSAGEIAEIIRQTRQPQIRAIAFETLAVMDPKFISPLLDDPLYFDIAVNVLDQQATEFDCDDARRILEQLDFPENGWQ